MKAHDKVKVGRLGKSVKELHGHVVLEVYDPKTGEVTDRRESDNTVTTYPQQLINEGNFQYLMNRSKVLPIPLMFGGVFLTNATEDPSDKLITFGSDIIAQADNTAYSGANTRRGSADLTPGGFKALSNGYQFAWDWGTNAGNGANITSICLSRAGLGAVNYDDTTPPSSSEPIFESMGGLQSWEVPEDLSRISVIDYENEKGYFLSYSAGTLTIDEYVVNTDKLHINGGNSLELGYQLSHNTISQTIDNYAETNCSVSYPGDGYLHIISFATEGDTIKDYKIDVSNLSAIDSIDTHTWSGAKFSEFNGNYGFMRDAMPIVGGFLYAYSDNNTKLVKCDMSSASITEMTLPSSLQGYGLNGPSCVLPNGDFFKFGTWNNEDGGNCLYYHNDTIYIAVAYDVGLSLYRNCRTSVECNTYGSIVARGTHNDVDASRRSLFVLTCFPHISTVYAVSPPVTKDSTKSMRLVYTLTES